MNMARTATLFSICLSLLLSVVALGDGQKGIDCETKVYFSPSGGCTDAVVKAISEAKASIRVQAYSFTSVPIAQAIVEAHKRGIDCKAILDKSQRTEKYSAADFLVNSGIETWIDDKPKIAHSKVIVIDDATVITGSFNFTKSAEQSNVENLLVIRSPTLAKCYLDNWNRRCALSEPYAGRSITQNSLSK